MNNLEISLIKKSENSHRVKRPTQTGFSSPATHYAEPRIDLNEVLVINSSATFFIRVVDDEHNEVGINTNDVLIVDKSITPKRNQLVLATVEDSFKIIKIDETSLSELNIWGTITYIIKSTL
ncbi:S24 family peptidase [Maribacter dokdonensis]|uniref:S24 family peptidase n=1 Tax=Maribacter dokdonensis TaxID=320912 RepID=UPI001C0969CD|nr:S24 family peptidase [Maribacter dokdonensis]MBU2901824.1 peptidase S24 [Maribacter dokdonensis]